MSRLSVSLRVMGDALEPDDITRLMCVEPKFAARKGEARKSAAGTTRQRSGIWTFGLETDVGDSWELDNGIVALLSRLPGDLVLWQQLRSTYRMDVFCGLFMGLENEGTGIRPETLELLASRGLTLNLDVYGPPPGI